MYMMMKMMKTMMATMMTMMMTLNICGNENFWMELKTRMACDGSF